MGLQLNSVKNKLLFALNDLFVVDLLSSCTEVQSTMVVPLLLSPTQSTLEVESTTPFLTRPAYPPSTLVDYTAQDGDTFFELATSEKAADVSVIGAVAADLFAQAILNGVKKANSGKE